MNNHKYKVGQSVYFSPNPGLRSAAQGDYRIVHRLPEDSGGYQYRIKSPLEPYERVAWEDQLRLSVIR